MQRYKLLCSLSIYYIIVYTAVTIQKCNINDFFPSPYTHTHKQTRREHQLFGKTQLSFVRIRLRLNVKIDLNKLCHERTGGHEKSNNPFFFGFIACTSADFNILSNFIFFSGIKKKN